MKLTRLLAPVALTACLASVNAQSLSKTALDMEIYTSEHYYKGLFDRPLYAKCTFRFDDVTRVGSYELTGYRQALQQAFGNGTAYTPESYINLWNDDFLTQYAGTLAEVPAAGKTVKYDTWYATHPDNENDMFPYDAPYQNASLVFQWFKPEAGVLCMMLRSEINTGGGMGASYASTTTPFYFDFNLNRRLTLDDLFKGTFRPTLLNLVREWVAQHADEICLLIEVNDVELSNLWEIRQGELVFIYPKYEISCGAAGNVEVPVYAYDISGLLRPGAKVLMGCAD